MKKVFIFVLLLMVCVPGRCQFFRNLDDWLKRRQEKQVYDTTYIFRPQERWLVRTRSFFSGEQITLAAVDGYNQSNQYGFMVGSGLNYRQTIGGGYRNLALDIGFSPFGKKTSADFAINIYGNRFGLKMSGAFTYGLSGSAMALGNTYDVQPGDIASIYGQVSAYYAFNGRRFSIPAAMNQSYRQRKSAGSLLATASACLLPVLVLEDAAKNLQVERAMCGLIGAGLGYGYNWVPSEHWLVHACVTETVGIWNAAYMVVRGYDQDFKRDTPIFVTYGSFAVLYYYRKWYFGMYADLDALVFLGKDNLDMVMGRMKNSTNLTVGVRF